MTETSGQVSTNRAFQVEPAIPIVLMSRAKVCQKKTDHSPKECVTKKRNWNLQFPRLVIIPYHPAIVSFVIKHGGWKIFQVRSAAPRYHSRLPYSREVGTTWPDQGWLTLTQNALHITLCTLGFNMFQPIPIGFKWSVWIIQIGFNKHVRRPGQKSHVSGAAPAFQDFHRQDPWLSPELPAHAGLCPFNCDCSWSDVCTCTHLVYLATKKKIAHAQ